MNICIIDDHFLLAQSLKSILDPFGKLHDIRLYRTAEDFLEDNFNSWKPDIILSDLLLPGISGMELIEAAKPTGAKFILLTSVTDAATVREALKKGVNGFLTKDISEEELKEALDQCLMGARYINSSLKDKLVDELFSDNQPSVNLSPRENEMLKLICEGHTPKEIAGKLNLSIYTIQQYNKNMMRKFKVNRTTEMVLLAIKYGLYNPQAKV